MSDPTNPHDGESAPEANGPGVATETPGTPDEVRRQRDDYLDQLRRAQAEFANFRKRSQTQAEADRQYFVGALAKDLLGVLDNFERAMDAARASGASTIVDGLELVHRQLLDAFAKHGIEPIAALGEPFDPNQHEALMQQPTADHPEGTVVSELGKGYRLRDRVLRPTKVAVSVKPNE
jgi:molecular chaperone GrpE